MASNLAAAPAIFQPPYTWVDMETATGASVSICTIGSLTKMDLMYTTKMVDHAAFLGLGYVDEKGHPRIATMVSRRDCTYYMTNLKGVTIDNIVDLAQKFTPGSPSFGMVALYKDSKSYVYIVKNGRMIHQAGRVRMGKKVEYFFFLFNHKKTDRPGKILLGSDCHKHMVYQGSRMNVGTDEYYESIPYNLDTLTVMCDAQRKKTNTATATLSELELTSVTNMTASPDTTRYFSSVNTDSDDVSTTTDSIIFKVNVSSKVIS